MWYTGYDGSNYRIGYATWHGVSEYGDDWKKWNESGGPVLDIGPPGSWDDARVVHSQVLHVNGTYRMWYRGNDGSVDRVGYATSTDGLTWEKYNCTGGPVLERGAPGAWDDFGVGFPAVVYDGSLFHMWYPGWRGVNWRIGYATSTDGAVWQKYNGDGGPVVDLGPAGAWDDTHIFGLEVLATATGGYEMWYTAQGNHSRIGKAENPSGDGVTWTKWSGNPILDIGPTGSWDETNVGYPSVYRDPLGRYHIWYSASNINQQWRIGYATESLWLEFQSQTRTTAIPPTGGVFNYTVSAGNYSDVAANRDLWFVFTHPDGTTELIRNVSGAVNSCNAQNFTYSESIPANWDAGTYTLEANVGIFPNSAKTNTLSFIKEICP